MAQIQISQTLADRLAKIAARKQRSLDELVEEILETHIPESSGGDEVDDAPPGSAAALIQAALAANIRSGYTDTAERSREILETEYPKYLRRKYRLDGNTDQHS